ncbi:GIP [Symbiodinium sp. CCMP2592]|nr:GIP [Symbiodinium sp. CCMP2592]
MPSRLIPVAMPNLIYDGVFTTGPRVKVKAAVMESSNSDGADGVQESVSRVHKQALKKELPWQAMSKEEVPKFVQALVDEWTEWQKWSSCRPVYLDVSKIDPALILKSRVCFRWKPKGGGDFKSKARTVVAGFVTHLIWNGDCQSAFLQGAPDDERPTSVFMRPPSDPVSKQAVPEWMDPSLLYKLQRPVYGQVNAPRRWYIHVRKVLYDLGWVTHSLACLFSSWSAWGTRTKLRRSWGCTLTTSFWQLFRGMNTTYSKCGARFLHLGQGDFVFVGRRICQQEDYSVTKTKLDPTEPLSSHPELVTEFRSGIGSLQWLSGTTRGDISADVSLLQKPPKELKVEDLLEINSVLRYVKATNGASYRLVPIPLDELMIVAYGPGFGNVPGGKSQGGLVVVATSKAALESSQAASLLEWRSYRHQRVLRSTLAAEAASLDKAEDYGNFLACMMSEMFEAGHQATMKAPLINVVPMTDARSLWDAVHRLTTSFQEKRVEISIAALRQQCRNLRWVPTEQQVADAMTKRSKALRDSFREWMASPTVTLVESRSPEDVQLPGQANEPWRTGLVNIEEC